MTNYVALQQIFGCLFAFFSQTSLFLSSSSAIPIRARIEAKQIPKHKTTTQIRNKTAIPNIQKNNAAPQSC